MRAHIALRLLVLALAACFVALAPAEGTSQTLAPLHHYFHSSNDHFYTTNWSELGGGGGDWTYQGITCYIVTAHDEGTQPLYRFYNRSYGKHLYTTYYDEVSGPQWIYEGIAGYVFTDQIVGTVPLHRWYRWQDGPLHYYTTNSGSLDGWVYEGIVGYVSPS